MRNAFFERLLHTLTICALLVSLLPARESVFASPETPAQGDISGSMRYGSGWDEDSAGLGVATREVFPQLAEQEDIAPEDPPKLTLKADPEIYIPGKPIEISWKIKNYKETTSKVFLAFHLPTGAIPSDQKLIGQISPDQSLEIPVDSDQGSISWQMEPAKASSPFGFVVDLVVDGEVIDTNAVAFPEVIDESMQVMNGKVTGLGGNVRISGITTERDLVFSVRTPTFNNLPSVSMSGNPIEIVAVDRSLGKNVTRFASPITIEITYQEEELGVWAEEDQLLYFFDEEIKDWFALETTVNTETNTLTAQTDHLTVFDYAASTWQKYALPTVDAFQVADFTGAATIDIDLWTPPGVAGLQPDLALHYNSQVIDDSSAFSQASWVGMGWNLELGAIVRNMHGTDGDTDDSFMLSLGGVSSMLLPTPDGAGVYHTADESFLKIVKNESQNTWTVWDKAGNIYTFDQRALTNLTNGCVTNPSVAWRWSLGSITDMHGNVLKFTYVNEKKNQGTCNNDVAVYPKYIYYGANESASKYRIEFVLENRTDYQTGWTASAERTLYAKQRLKEIRVQHSATSNWSAPTTVKKYVLTYAPNDAASNVIYHRFNWTAGGRTSTLRSVQEFNGDGSASLPAMTFNYSVDSMHIDTYTNGQGGRVQVAYERWTYFDDFNKTIRAYRLRYAALPDGTECYNAASGPTGWSAVTGIVRCDGSRLLQVGQYGALGIGHHSIPAHLVKPGGRYRFLTNARSINGSGTDVNWGIIDTSDNQSAMLYSDSWTPSLDTTGRDMDGSLDMPVRYDPVDVRLRIEADNAFVRLNEFVLMPMVYRVTSRTVTDMATNTSGTYTYTYENPMPNTPAVSKAAKDYETQLYTPSRREFRGHAMTQVTAPNNLTSVTWYHQSDDLKGRPYRSLAMSRDYYDGMDALGSGWTKSTVGTFTTVNAVDEGQYIYHFDNAQKVISSVTNWSVWLKRAGTLQDGKVAVAQFKVTGTSTQAEVGLAGSAGQFFGMVVKPSGSAFGAYLRTDRGSGLQDSPAAFASIERDQWYTAMFFIDDDDGVRIKLWQLDAANLGAAELEEASFPAQTWQFRARVNSGAFWLDNYFEGSLHSETETIYASDTLYDAIAGNTIPDISSLTSFKDLQVVWARPAEAVTRVYDGDADWQGTRETYEYLAADQNGSQYGNLTRTTFAGNDGAGWVDHYATRTQYWPLNNGTQYLVGFPARQTTIDCAAACNLTGDPLLGEALYFYDGQSSYAAAPTAGKLTMQRVLVDRNGGDRYAQSGYSYDSYGNVSGVTAYTGYGTATADPATPPLVTQREYDGLYHTYLVSETNPLDQTTTTEYDYGLGLPRRVSDPNGAQSGAAYDSLGRMTAVCAPYDWDGVSCGAVNATLQIAYTNYAAGSPYRIQLTQKLDESQSMQFVRYYGGTGNLLQEQTPGAVVLGSAVNVVTDYQYDAMGRLVRQRKPYTTDQSGFRPQSFPSDQSTTTTYDLLGRVVSVTEPNGTQVSSAYDELSVTVTNARGAATTQHYDVWGSVVGVDAAEGPGLAYSYDKLGRLTFAHKVNGGTAITTTAIVYDVGGRKVAMSDPDMGDWSYAYDALGNLVGQTDAENQTIFLCYDELNRLTGKAYNAAPDCGDAGDLSITYAYDGGVNGIGRRTGMADESGVTAWSYDLRGRMVREERSIDGFTYVTGWAYNAADLVTAMTYPDGEVVEMAYSNQGQLLSAGSGAMPYVQGILYDEAGRMRELGLGEGSGAAAVTRQYGYYPWGEPTDGGRLAWLVSSNQAAQTLQNLAYTYDNNGNIAAIDDTVNAETSTFIYDTLDRLTGMGISGSISYTEAFSFDGASGRMESRTPDGGAALSFTYDDANHYHAVTGLGDNEYVYDANGNMVERVMGEEAYTLAYDPENRLTGVSGETAATYVYDGDGQLVKAIEEAGVTITIGGYFEAFTPAEAPPDDPTPTPTATATATETPTPTATETPQAAAFPRTGLLDDFDRADGGLGSNWSSPVYPGDPALTLQSNQVRSDNDYAGSYWNAATCGDPCEVWVEVPVQVSADGYDSGVMFIKDPGTASLSGYYLGMARDGSMGVMGILRVDSGELTLLAEIERTLANGDAIGLERDGATLRAWHRSDGTWTQIWSGTDATYASPYYLGINMGGATPRFDNFGGGTIGGGDPGTPTPTPTPTATSQPPAFPYNGILDNFNRSNGGLGANWGGPVWEDGSVGRVANNRAAANASTGQAVNYWSAATFGPNAEAYADIYPSGGEIGLWISLSGSMGGDFGGYMVNYTPGEGALIIRWDHSEWGEVLAEDESMTFASGDGMGITKVGSTITAYKRSGGVWTAILSAEDDTYGAGYIGMMIFDSTGSRLDNFGGGTIPWQGWQGPTPTPTATPQPPVFPLNNVLDDFNRGDGWIGSSWTGDFLDLEIDNQQLVMLEEGPIYWNDAIFGADQEAYMTISAIDAEESAVSLLLKCQSNGWGGEPLLEVYYDPLEEIVAVYTFNQQQDWQQHGPDIEVVFEAGDQFGAIATADGVVMVFRNGQLLGEADITSWPTYSEGGRIGLWGYGTEGLLRLDDFGGGTRQLARAPFGVQLAGLFEEAWQWVEGLVQSVKLAFAPPVVQAQAEQGEVLPPEGQVPPGGMIWKNYVLVGGQRVAMREYTATTSEVYFLLGDHLGSTSVTTDSAGVLVSELRYSAYGEERYSSGTTPTDYQYTGQLSKMGSIGLYYYNARWYDPYINHFVQADTMVPGLKNPQAWDRFAYGLNNPVKYNDPSGHCVWDACLLEGTFVISTGMVIVVGIATVVVIGGIAYAVSPDVRTAVDQAFSTLAVDVEEGFEQAAERLRSLTKSTGPKPLTKDEQEKVDHLNNDLEDFLNDHPDLEEEVKQKAKGIELPYDHPREAEQYTKGVENDIRHLESAREHRSPEGQRAIDQAISNGRKFVEKVRKLLEAK